MPTASLDLPFAVPAKERDKAFTPSMEVAAIFILAETKRPKQGLFGAKPAKISFVSKLHYPLWATPWENRSLIVDGLGLSLCVIAKQQLPDVRLFVEDIERGAAVRELFRDALENHLNTFNDFAGRVHVQMDSLVADNEVLSALTEHAEEALSKKRDGETAIALAPPRLDVQAAAETAKLAMNLHKQIRSEIASLEYARSLLDDTTKLHEQMILKEISVTREAFDAQVAQLAPEVEKKVDRLIKKRDARIAKVNRSNEIELRVKERQKARQERELQRLELSKAGLVGESKSRRQNRIRATENRIDEVKDKVHALAAIIEKTQAQAEAEIEKTKQGYQWLIDQETRKIRDTEAQRDEAVEVKQREIEALKLVVRKITDAIDSLGARKQEEAEELKRLSLTHQFDDVTLLCLPFYLVGYQIEDSTRFHVLPPVKVLSSEGVMAAIRKKLGDFRAASRVSLFLQPRSKAVSRMLGSVVEEKMKSDKTFGEDLLEATVSSNIMLRGNFKEMLTKGVAELKAEGWITLKEEDSVKVYT